MPRGRPKGYKVQPKPVSDNPIATIENFNTTLIPIEITDRDEQILYLFLFAGLKQCEIADKFGLSNSTLSYTIHKLMNKPEVHSRLVTRWEKEYSVKARKLALDLLDNIDPKTHASQRRAIDSTILVDKARLLDGESTENVAVTVEHLEDRRRYMELAREVAAHRLEQGRVSQTSDKQALSELEPIEIKPA